MDVVEELSFGTPRLYSPKGRIFFSLRNLHAINEFKRLRQLQSCLELPMTARKIDLPLQEIADLCGVRELSVFGSFLGGFGGISCQG
jgi:hypothetical protein